MTLEKFFEQGNRIAVIGSFIYLPHEATDLDFVLYTKGGKNPLDTHPRVSEEIKSFFKSQYGDHGLKLDYVFKSCSMNEDPYDIDNLPKDERWLDYHLLIGKFFPDSKFIEDHYKNTYGKRFFEEAWKKFSKYVVFFQNQEARLYKRHKDLPLLLKVTERLADRNKGVNEIIEKYRESHKLSNKKDYGQQCKLINKFVKEASFLIL